MSNLSLLNSTEVLIIYGTVCSFLYVATDGLRREAPFIRIIPPLTLTILTLTSRMKRTIKLFTSLTFLAFGLLSRWHNNLQTICGLFTIAHILYILSFISSIRRLWFGFALLVTAYISALLYFCFIDLFWSIPILVFNFSFHFITFAISLIVAGSIWYCGSKRENAQQAALLRFLGLLSFMACASLLILNLFGSRIDRFNYISITLFYIGQPLLFVANQRML